MFAQTLIYHTCAFVVCMYVCMYVCVYVCMYVHLSVCQSVCRSVGRSVGLSVCLSVCMYLQINPSFSTTAIKQLTHVCVYFGERLFEVITLSLFRNEWDSALATVAHRLTKEGDNFLGEKIIDVRTVGHPMDVWHKLGVCVHVHACV